jgi:hypothetical protein
MIIYYCTVTTTDGHTYMYGYYPYSYWLNTTGNVIVTEINKFES